ncbi:MAG: RecX family transcriptional regulator [Lachnospiraceae bacterium]|nr:RecX family transcriptional regulator [Lachnospiraceae bacterium]
MANNDFKEPAVPVTPGEQDPVQVVKQYIFRQMEIHQLKEGDRLPSEIALSQHLNVPRSCVRDALQSLKNIGLLHSIRGSGYMLSPMFDYSLSEILRAMMSVSNISKRDITDVRQALERKAIELITKKDIPHDAFEVMEHQVHLMEKHSMVGKPEDLDAGICMGADKEFHRQMAIVSGNTFIRVFNTSLNQYNEGHVSRHWEKMTMEHSDAMVDLHRSILENLKRKDVENALEDLDEHYRVAEKIMKKLYDAELEDMKELQSIISALQRKGFKAKQIQAKLKELG